MTATKQLLDEHGFAYDLPGGFHDVGEFKREHRQRGGFYFEGDTVCYFKARTHEVIAGAILIDSVKHDDNPRSYRMTIMQHGRGMARIKDPRDGATEFTSLASARQAAQRVCVDCGVGAWDVDNTKRPGDWGEIRITESTGEMETPTVSAGDGGSVTITIHDELALSRLNAILQMICSDEVDAYAGDTAAIHDYAYELHTAIRNATKEVSV
jgi:hypothetical protein